MLRQITRTRLSYTQLRCLSTAPNPSVNRSVDEPSSNYRRGKEGYAPGMPHPPGSSASPMPPPAPRSAASLPEMSKKHGRKANGSSSQKFEYKMTQLRHQYQKEHLKSQDAERAEMQKQRKGALRRLQGRQAADREENERRLAFEKLMQPKEGMAALSGPQRQAQVQEFVRARKVQREENYRQVEEAKSQERLDAMVRLYHEAESFVTMENLDAKIHEFYETGLTLQSRVYIPGVSDLVADVMENGGQVSYSELLKREQELKDALEGTVSGGKVGAETAKASVDAGANTPSA
ncbi:hypothetical protein BGW38_003776 [Lunasporangiospora selenospora]|uniref:Uncharacterized protein n=1 Tax=Lunasporangiospora selenospora TaxID=979761 RepID=A0A9P6FR19_9FUNG|nr:hypothetical protein BGW38_003776 [Lunasporangiospora selenospora]